MVALPDKGNASERWRRKATGLHQAAGLPKEMNHAPPPPRDRCHRGLRCTREYPVSGVVDSQPGRSPPKASLAQSLAVADAEPVSNADANPHAIPVAHSNSHSDPFVFSFPFPFP
jgi:hypothetical protein